MNISLKLTAFHFNQLLVRGYSLDHIFVLHLIEKEIDILSLPEKSAKYEVLISTLKRKGLVTDDLKITIEGKELLTFLTTKSSVKLVKQKISSSSFDEFWKTFPGTDTFTIHNVSFNGSRSLRVNKENCKIKWEKIINEGEYPAEIIIKAIELDVLQKKEMSYKKRENKLTYMQNSLTYLNQRSYEPFIDLLSDKNVIEKKEEVKIYTGINI